MEHSGGVQYDPRMLSQGQGGSAQGGPKSLPLIDSTTARVSSTIERLSTMVGIVKEFNDTTRGTEPPIPQVPGSHIGGNNSQPGAVPRGELLLTKLDQLEVIVQILGNQLARLSGI